jgi:ABC-type uncharacterized transport system involved in gliding motility auxiliary subunit
MSALFGALGLVAILFALAGYFMAVGGAAPRLPSIINGIFGVVLLGAAALINLDGLRERVTSGEARRASKYGSSSLISTLLVIAILGMGAFLTNRYPKRFDWSEQSVHSLSDQTLKVLSGLDQDVEALALFGRMDWEPVRRQLDRYAYASERFRIIEIADPNEKPDLLGRYGLSPEQLGRGIVHLIYGGESVNVEEPTEETLTNAIVKLTRRGDKTVYFLEGHGENPIDGANGAAEEGYQQAAEALRNENYKIEKLLLAAKSDVPEDADVVVVAGASRLMLDEEREALDRYIKRGGAVLALVDPRVRTDMVAKLSEWGVELGDDIVIDYELAVFGRATTPFASQYAQDHPITQDLRDYTMFHVARSVKPTAGAEARFTEIVLTGPKSWAERDLERYFSGEGFDYDDEDLAGPVPIAVAGTVVLEGVGDMSQEARLVVFGDADFASNQMLGTYQNRDLFVNTVNWLLGDVEAISVRPNRARASQFQMSASQKRTVQLLALFAIPQILAVVGVTIWWTRRQTARR